MALAWDFSYLGLLKPEIFLLLEIYIIFGERKILYLIFNTKYKIDNTVITFLKQFMSYLKYMINE